MSISRRRLLQIIAGSAVLSACGGRSFEANEPPLNSAPIPDGGPSPEKGMELIEDLTQSADFSIPDGWDYPANEELLPFGHGVASGDPLQDRVILWTRVTVPDVAGYRANPVQNLENINVAWAIATDKEFTDIKQSGVVNTNKSLDWTVKVDASGLDSATVYYYAFAALGRTSIIGRTKTAPSMTDPVNDIRIAHAACTSYWSMDFHPYSRVGERNDIDLFCHAGDHVYEFVDSKGWYRARNDRFDLDYVDFRKWQDRDECARRYALYYSDPDLLYAHQSTPFAIMPDQHDFDDEENFSESDAAEVFWLWTPSRPTDKSGNGEFLPSPGPNKQVVAPVGEHAKLDYRCLSYGQLCDILLIDIRRFRASPDEAQQPMAELLGNQQTEWLKQKLLDSKEKSFRVIVNQINMSQLGTTEVVPAAKMIFGDNASGPELYTSGWGGNIPARRDLYSFFRDNNIIDNIVFSGDSHGWFAHDLIEDPSAPNYLPAVTSDGPQGLLQTVGVELVPSAFGRPGGGEVVAGSLYSAAEGRNVNEDYQNFRDNYVPAGNTAVMALEQAAMAGNPNLRYFNWRTYGYGLSHITKDAHVMELWEVPNPGRTDEQTLIQQFDNRVGNPGLLARPASMRTPTVGTDPSDQVVDVPSLEEKAPISTNFKSIQ